jgi:hypothetical protein
MAKAKPETESKSHVFRRLFLKQPELLRGSSFDPLIEMFKKEFPDREFTDNDRQIAANVKSRMRKEFKIRRRRRRAKAAAGNESAPAHRPLRGTGVLAALEEQIDNCLISARRLDREELSDVIKHLHRARNLLIVRMGE